MSVPVSQQYFNALFELRRNDPEKILTTHLVQAEEAGDKLSDEELTANIMLLFGAGHETTSNLIGNGLLALHNNPGQLALMKHGEINWPNAIEELLRYDSSVQLTPGRVWRAQSFAALKSRRASRLSGCWARPIATRVSTIA